MTEDQLYTAVANVIEDVVGTRGSGKLSVSGSVSAIFKDSVAKQLGQKLYGLAPYVRMVSGIVTNQGSNKHSIWYDSTTGNKVTQTIVDVDFTIQVVGGDATDIAQEIKKFLLLSESATATLCEAGIVASNAGPIRPSTVNFRNAGRDSAFFLVTLTTTDTLIEDVSSINTVSADLNVRHHGSEDNIVSTTINIDNT